MSNLVPQRYRSVSVAEVDGPMTEAALRERFLGREAYRRTAFIVARTERETALLQVTKASDEPLFSRIIDVRLLAGPDETTFVVDPQADTGIPTQLARVAAEHAPDTRCVVVRGRYEHVSFILDPRPIEVRVVEVEPPRPAKLVDQVRRVLDVADELPPVDLRPESIDLVELARTRPAVRYLYPCRGSGVSPPGAEVRYLDQRPSREDWVLVGCRRSLDIHRWFYGSEPPYVEMCPRELTQPSNVPALTKCCILEFGVEQEDGVTIVPWGATLDEVREGLRVLLRTAEPAWAPA